MAVELAATGCPPRAKAESALKSQADELKRAQTYGGQIRRPARSLMGLERPLTQLKNPGLYSIPLGFLGVILGSILWRRDRKAEQRWEELYVRQNTGIEAERN